MNPNLPAVQHDGPVVAVVERALSVVDVRQQVNLIQEIMHNVMKKDEHYGVIPGTGNKPTLLKAGAEKLLLTFRLDPQYEVTEKYDGDHLSVTSRCTLYHIPTGQRFGSGMGSCSTKESKYAYRTGQRKCPNCGKEAIIKGKDEYGGGWLCFAKKGGCNAKFKDGDKVIEGQEVGKIPNDSLPDQYNTVMKMANKRSLVAAVLNVTAASDIFTQDIEDMDGLSNGQEKGTITPTTGSLDGLTGERQSVVMATAAAVKKAMAEDRAMDALGLCETSGFVVEEKKALWSLLPSEVRSALKRLAEAEKAAGEGTISEPDKKRLEKMIKEFKLDRENVKAFCKESYGGKEHFSELTPAELADLEECLKDMKAAATKEPA